MTHASSAATTITIPLTAIARCDCVMLLARRTVTIPHPPMMATAPMTRKARITRRKFTEGRADRQPCVRPCFSERLDNQGFSGLRLRTAQRTGRHAKPDRNRGNCSTEGEPGYCQLLHGLSSPRQF